MTPGGVLRAPERGAGAPPLRAWFGRCFERLGRRYFVRRKPAGQEKASGWYSMVPAAGLVFAGYAALVR